MSETSHTKTLHIKQYDQSEIANDTMGLDYTLSINGNNADSMSSIVDEFAKETKDNLNELNTEVIKNIKINGEIVSKSNNETDIKIDIPSRTSELINDSEFVSKYHNHEYLSNDENVIIMPNKSGTIALLGDVYSKTVDRLAKTVEDTQYTQTMQDKDGIIATIEDVNNKTLSSLTNGTNTVNMPNKNGTLATTDDVASSSGSICVSVNGNTYNQENNTITLPNYPTSLPANGGNSDTVDGKRSTDFIASTASCNKNWNWNGLGGQPQWLWGGENGTDMYVYNPSNFRVANANTLKDRDLCTEVDNLKQSVANGKQAVVDAINNKLGYASGLTTAHSGADYAWWIANKIQSGDIKNNVGRFFNISSLFSGTLTFDSTYGHYHTSAGSNVLPIFTVTSGKVYVLKARNEVNTEYGSMSEVYMEEKNVGEQFDINSMDIIYVPTGSAYSGNFNVYSGVRWIKVI